MSLAEAQFIPRPERRRSERSPLAMPVIVRGVSLDAKPFQEETFTLSVSAHGALVAMGTTVTLGQALFVRNPQTQEEAGAWVTRFGPPRGGMAQVGIEFVQPGVQFWSAKPQPMPSSDAERRAEQQIHVLPSPSEGAAAEPDPFGSADETPHEATISALPDAPAAAASPDVLLHALEQTLQHAAEQAVAVAATARLGTSVNQAATAIENFSNARIRQIDERLVQYRQEFVAAAHEVFLTQLKADAAQTEERLRSQTEAAMAALAESHEKIRAEVDRAVSEVEQRVASLTSQGNEACAGWEARLRAFQQVLTSSNEQEVEQFRERLRNILTTLLASLG